MIDVGFWEFIVTDYSEVHAESYIPREVLGDAYCVYTTGAVPIQIRMSGYLLTTPLVDHRIDFLTVYQQLLRGTQSKKTGLPVGFALKETLVYLDITQIAQSTAATIPNMTALTITGLGYNYLVAPDAIKVKITTSTEDTK